MSYDAEPEDELVYNCTAMMLHEDFFARQYTNTSVWSLNRTRLDSLVDDMVTDLKLLPNIQLQSDLLQMFSECVYPPLRKYDMVWWQKLVWTSVFSIMVLIATTGNAIVMWIVLAHRRMRTVTNYFLVNLSLSDLLMALLNCIFNFIFMLNSDWPFGPIYCTINNFVANISVAASVFTLMAISMDRYMAIVRPLHHHMSRRKARVALIMIWLASCLLAFPCILFSTTKTKSYKNGQTATICFMLWPDGHYPISMLDYVYNLVILGVTYIVPVTAMAVCYSLMGCELWGSRSIGEFTQRQVDSVKSKRKVVRMFIIVVTIFALCWLPYHGYFIYAYHNNEFARNGYVQHMYLAFYWFAMANTMVNPIIYYWMNTRFRQYFQQIICHCSCFRSKDRGSFELTSTKPYSQQSELGRSRSARCNNPALGQGCSQRQGHRASHRQPSYQWQTRTQETQVRHLSINGRITGGVDVCMQNGVLTTTSCET